MRRIIYSVALILIPIFTLFSQVGIGTVTPNESAQLDVSSIDRGFLPPRVSLTATNSASPVTNPAVGLLVYNVSTSGGSPTNVTPGYYYWNGSSWYPVVNKGTNAGDMQYWNGSKWINIQLGLNGQNLTICNGVPVWGPCTNTFTSSPTNNSFEGIINPYAANTFINGLQQFYIKAWTNNGEPFNGRYMVKFDQSSIPPNAVIDSAKLYIYGDPAPINGNKIDAHYGPTNAFYIQRITSVWNVSGMYTWNNPPTATTTNQVLVTQSISAFQNDVVDVTQLVKDMQVNGNNGFFMKLQTEVTYNSRQYLSSFYGDASKRPRLVISYH